MVESLEQALRELDDYADDVARSNYRTAQDALRRYVARVDDDGPLQDTLARLLPEVDFDDWYARASETTGGMVGSGVLSWPTDALERVALQLELVRRLADERVGLLEFTMDFTYGGRRFDSNIREFVSQVFRPFHRDVNRLVRRFSRSDARAGHEVPRALLDMLGDLSPTAALEDPVELSRGLANFRRDHGDHRCAFLIMQFGQSELRKRIADAVRDSLQPHGIRALRADDKDYLDDLFANVSVYMHGCEFGIAVFERVTEDATNPNISLEVGYMLGAGKHVCLLKDRTLKTLQTDLTGRLYKPFDVENPGATIQPELERWLGDRDLL